MRAKRASHRVCSLFHLRSATAIMVHLSAIYCGEQVFTSHQSRIRSNRIHQSIGLSVTSGYPSTRWKELWPSSELAAWVVRLGAVCGNWVGRLASLLRAAKLLHGAPFASSGLGNRMAV